MNQNYTNKKVDYYLDIDGNPVGKGSKASHILIKGKAKFAFVGTNNEGYITTFHTESGKTFWKLLNGENIPVINPK